MFESNPNWSFWTIKYLLDKAIPDVFKIEHLQNVKK